MDRRRLAYPYEGAFRRFSSAAYRRGDNLFCAPKARPLESASKDAARYGLHPALLDAALHVLALQCWRDCSTGRLPFRFAWQVSGVATRPGVFAVRRAGVLVQRNTNYARFC